MSSPRLRLHEDSVLARVVQAFSTWLDVIRDPVLVPARRFLGLPNPTGVFSGAATWREQVARLRPDLETAARIGWSEAFDRPTFSSTNSHVLSALDASENFLVNVPNEVHDMVVDVLGQGLNAGRSHEQITEDVNLLLRITGTDRFRNRAQTITTTEVTRAANAGALAAALQAQQELGVILKQWNNSADDRVRETHELTDNAEIPLNQPFMVGGFPMMFPADPSGPPHEVISCRCDLSFRRLDAT